MDVMESLINKADVSNSVPFVNPHVYIFNYLGQLRNGYVIKVFSDIFCNAFYMMRTVFTPISHTNASIMQSNLKHPHST